jgi:hypothetical protein
MSVPVAGVSQKQLSLIFHHKAGNEELVLGNAYITPLGEKITVQKFRYYISNVSVTDKQGKTSILPVDYFLVDEADSLSRTIHLSVPDNAISSIQFLLGVDSIRNVSGVQTGALDPMKGMFWTWNSGYIMAKLEGVSESSTIAGHYFTYHIGGFKGANNTLKTISLTLPQSTTAVQEVHINADINTWFKNSSDIRTSETAVCHMPGPLAKKIADNYNAMFSINAVR